MKKKEFTKTLILNSTSLSEKLILDLLKESKNYDVLVISYEIDSLHIPNLMEMAQNYNCNSFDCYLPKTKNVDEIKSKLSALKEESIVFILGLEKIFLNTDRKSVV